MVRTYTPKAPTSRQCVICGTRFKAKRTDARFCGTACRLRASRYKSGATTAHQYRLKSETDNCPIYDGSLSACEVREVSRDVAVPILTEYEWLGDAGLCNRFWSGSDPQGRVMTVVGFVTHAHRLSDGGRTVLLARGCTTPAAHPHAASWAIGRAFRALKAEGVQRVIAYADPLAGERGVVYSAVGMRPADHRPKYRMRIRPPGVRWYEHDKCLSDRWLAHKGWSTEQARAHGYKVERVPQRIRWEKWLG